MFGYINTSAKYSRLSCCFPYYLSIFDVSSFSDVTSSVIFFLSVTFFFFIATSLTYGFFMTSASSLFTGIFISFGDCMGLCASVWPLGGLLLILTSSLVRGTSTVLVSVTGFLVMVA